MAERHARYRQAGVTASLSVAAVVFLALSMPMVSSARWSVQLTDSSDEVASSGALPTDIVQHEAAVVIETIKQLSTRQLLDDDSADDDGNNVRSPPPRRSPPPMRQGDDDGSDDDDGSNVRSPPPRRSPPPMRQGDDDGSDDDDGSNVRSPPPRRSPPPMRQGDDDGSDDDDGSRRRPPSPPAAKLKNYYIEVRLQDFTCNQDDDDWDAFVDDSCDNLKAAYASFRSTYRVTRLTCASGATVKVPAGGGNRARTINTIRLRFYFDTAADADTALAAIGPNGALNRSFFNRALYESRCAPLTTGCRQQALVYPPVTAGTARTLEYGVCTDIDGAFKPLTGNTACEIELGCPTQVFSPPSPSRPPPSPRK